jgi:hypothetical protein
MAKRIRKWIPLLYVIAGAFAVVAVLDIIFGSALEKWFGSTYIFDTPLLGSVVLMLIIAIVPFVILVNSAEDDDKGKH